MKKLLRTHIERDLQRLDQHVQKIAQGGTVEVVAGDVAADLVANKESMRKAARMRLAHSS